MASYTISTTSTVPSIKEVVMVRARRDAAALLFERTLYEGLAGFGLLATRYAKRVAKSAKDAYAADLVQHSIVVGNLSITFKKVS